MENVFWSVRNCSQLINYVFSLLDPDLWLSLGPDHLHVNTNSSQPEAPSQ